MLMYGWIGVVVLRLRSALAIIGLIEEAAPTVVVEVDVDR